MEPDDWEGLGVLDYPALHTARCFGTGIAIFLVHWSLYHGLVHNLSSRALCNSLSAALIVSYHLCVIKLHPWNPYWIRELSVMLAQLYAWKVGAWIQAGKSAGSRNPSGVPPAPLPCPRLLSSTSNYMYPERLE